MQTLKCRLVYKYGNNTSSDVVTYLDEIFKQSLANPEECINKLLTLSEWLSFPHKFM